MENPAQRREADCPETEIRICVASQCSCVSPETGLSQQAQVGGVTQSSIQRCQVTISYVESRPTMPELYFSSGACGVNAELALAMALAYFLKGTANVHIP
jgi:hypothetical protein